VPGDTYVKPHPVKLTRKGGTVFMRLSPLVLSALGLSTFDFVAVSVRGGEIRARKIDFSGAVLEKSKRRPLVRRVKT
jgi:hypothetical protein